MEKLEKEETLDDQLEQFKNFGFNVDDLVNMLNDEEKEEEED